MSSCRRSCSSRPLIEYELEPGTVVPNPNGGNGNPFIPLFVIILGLVIGLHYADGNIRPRTNQQEVRQQNGN